MVAPVAICHHDQETPASACTASVSRVLGPAGKEEIPRKEGKDTALLIHHHEAKRLCGIRE